LENDAIGKGKNWLLCLIGDGVIQVQDMNVDIIPQPELLDLTLQEKSFTPRKCRFVHQKVK
jgi:hypothetical protein